MSQKWPKRTDNFQEAATLAMAAKAQELKEKGRKIISLSLGEPDFDTPMPIKKAAIAAVEKNFSHYSPVNGFLSLREAICKKLLRDNQLAYTPDQIVVSTGAKQAIYNLFQVLVEEQEEVILPAPYWVSYESLIKMVGAKPQIIYASATQNFKITPEQLEEKINAKTKLFVFNSPSNPTGAVYSEDEIRSLGKVLEKYPEVWILADEIYEYICFEEKHFSFAQIPALKDRVLLINGVSKGYAMTGYRVGFSATTVPIAKMCTALQSQVSSGTCAVAQKAAEYAFLSDPQIAKEMVDAFEKRRNLMLEKLAQIKGIICPKPTGAFYVFPQINAFFGKKYNQVIIENSSDLALYLLDQAGVATVAGDHFGAPDHLRLAYTTDEKSIFEALENIKKALEKLV